MYIICFFRFLLSLLFPPRCRCCRTLQNVFVRPAPDVLCPSCLAAWRVYKEQRCTSCSLPSVNCRCVPKALRLAGCEALVSCAPYHSQGRSIVKRLILLCKTKRDRALFFFFARDLSVSLLATLSATNALITWVPRRLSAHLQYGHDQAKELAYALSGQTELTCRATLVRRGNAEQKLAASATVRAANAAHSYFIRRRARVQGKTVVLVDDVCTTGQTLAACCRVLYEAGAARVICVTVAKTPYEHDESKPFLTSELDPLRK